MHSVHAVLALSIMIFRDGSCGKAHLRQHKQLAGAHITLSSGNDDSWHHGHESSQQAPLPGREADAQESFHHNLRIQAASCW